MRTILVLLTLLCLAACNGHETVGQDVRGAATATGNAVGNAADSTGRALGRAGTATRDTLDPPRGPAERAGRAADRAVNPY